MSRARHTHSSPGQLFPFLAVLVSTMGALILLLLAINRQATLQALAKALSSLRHKAHTEEKSLNSRRRELQATVTELHDMMNRVTRRQEYVDQRLVAASERSRSEAKQVESLQRELERRRRSRTASERETQKAHERIRSLEAATMHWSAEPADADRVLVPVVHPGANGTTRQPIYVECVADAVILQPEGIRVATTTLPDSAAADLLTRGVQALARYYLQPGAGDDRESEPYPLLLVRPAGIMNYYLARHAVMRLGRPFGYELIEAESTLRYPEPDPGARAAALAAMRSSLVGAPVVGTGHDKIGGESDFSNARSNHPTATGDRTPPEAVMDRGADSPAKASVAAPIVAPEPPQPRAAQPSSTASLSPAGHYPALTSQESRDSLQTGKIPVLRKIEVDCTAKNIVVGPRAVKIPLDALHLFDQVVERLRAEVDRELSNWGPPGMTFRWEPQLVFSVHSDALETFYRLRLALADNPFVIEHQIVTDDEPAWLEGASFGQDETPTLIPQLFTE